MVAFVHLLLHFVCVCVCVCVSYPKLLFLFFTKQAIKLASLSIQFNSIVELLILNACIWLDWLSMILKVYLGL